MTCPCAGPECFCVERRLEKLEKVLTELQGFAERNLARAILAHVVSKEVQAEDNRESTRINVSVQEARVHEAERFLLVIRDRIAEARA